MSESTKKKNLLDRLTYKYRLLIINENTFEQRASIRLSRMNIYGLFSALFLVIAALVFSLIAFTPVKYYLPGMESSNSRAKLLNLQYRTDSLEQVLNTQRLWTDNYRRILDDDLDSSYYRGSSNRPVQPDSIDLAAMNAEELALRERMENEEDFNLVPSASGTQPSDATLADLQLYHPVDGIIVAGFDADAGHYGIDIAAADLAPVQAALPGVVISSEWSLQTGHVLVVQHAGELVTFYRHNARALKRAGDRVDQGEAIALLGNSGELTTGPHLHFELWWAGRPVDPSKFITLEMIK